MKRILIAAAALSVLATAGAASAQSYGAPQGNDRYERQDDRSGQRGTQPNERGGRQDRGDNDRGDTPRGDQGRGDQGRGDHGRGDHADRGNRHDGDRYGRGDYRDGRYNGPGYGQWAHRSPHRYHAGRYQAPRGYYARNWRRGEYLPPVYRGRGYYVDYRAYRLPPPPRGYGYYRHGDDVILTAIATGLIASVVFDLFD
jgi:Ni/Co efflux regulator RcnB